MDVAFCGQGELLLKHEGDSSSLFNLDPRRDRHERSNVPQLSPLGGHATEERNGTAAVRGLTVAAGR